MEYFWEIPSKFTIYMMFSIVFCSLLLLKKWLKSKSVVSPEEKAVLITGCDMGFGYRLALRLNSMGYRVYATVLDMKSADSLTKESSNANQIVVLKMDVTIDEEVSEVYERVRQDLRLNNCILWSVVNNAGYAIVAQLEWVDLDHYKNMFEVNVFGMVRVTKTFLPLVREARGRVVFMSSILGLETLNGYGTYCMTKYAITAFARTLRREVTKFGVKVVVLYPGGYKNTTLMESVYKSLDSIWHRMGNSLKNSYGNQQYFEFWKNRQIFIRDHMLSTKNYLVINDLVDAVTNSVPNNEYKPIGWAIGSVLTFLLPVVPSSLVDLVDSY